MTAKVSLRFYGSLGDFLPADRRGRSFEASIAGQPSVKDAIESAGVPHVEVELLLIDGVSASFLEPLHDGARVSAYPRFHALNAAPVSRVRVPDPDPPRFVLDVHLGALTRHLRLFGHDAAWPRDAADPELAAISEREGRILLTRDRGLLKRRSVTRGYCVRSSDPEEQLVEVVARYDLLERRDPFSRCIACNGVLRPVDADALRGRVPPRVLRVHDRFSQCSACEQPYWGGTHHERLRKRVERLRARVLAAAYQRAFPSAT